MPSIMQFSLRFIEPYLEKCITLSAPSNYGTRCFDELKDKTSDKRRFVFNVVLSIERIDRKNMKPETSKQTH